MILRALSFLALAYALGFVVFMLGLGQPLDDRRTDAIVVPTGGAGRIDRGLALMEDKRADRMLISGVDPSVRPIELALEYRVRPALFECCIDLGQEAIDTRSNGDETADWVRKRGYKSVRLVTADWHMARARLELDNALDGAVEVVGDPVRTNARFATLFDEYNKLLIRRVALWVGFAG
ncbi:YdcF family protein [Sphingomonas sp. S1-29]|uniref:YdcF family protein n=1 Tax=Sphingomonas qomolangmaensis TaxID=2918765 RepID=A0ABY5L8P2_9SPHN|nr:MULTISPECIES: YdcF family protein [Sphingomonas]UUL82217.1 YdcF family protein [Sphingomonas qomolangmaensis]UZK68765.1 YdcF family protein [Sphingomonas sp. S1-29]